MTYQHWNQMGAERQLGNICGRSYVRLLVSVRDVRTWTTCNVPCST